MVAKKKQTVSQKRAVIVEKLIRLTYSSLESHLSSTYATKVELGKLDGNVKFQKQCVKDYAETIKLITDLY